MLHALLHRLAEPDDHRRRTLHADAVGRAHEREPVLRHDLLRTHPLPHAIHEDLRAAARQAVKPRRLQAQQRLTHREPRLPREMLDLRRRERMDHDRRELPLDRAQHLLVVRQPEIRVQAALDHHLRAARLDRLAHLREDLLRRQEIRILRPLPPEKRAEPALIHTDIRIIDIPVDEERHRIAEPLPTHRVRRPSERQEIALPQEPRPLCRR